MRSSYFVQFFGSAAIGASIILIPILAEQLGLNLFQLGLVGSAYSIGAFISYYFFGRLSDRTGNRKGIIVFGMLASFFAFSAQVLMHGFLSMLAIRFAVGFALGIYTFPLVAMVSEFSSGKRVLAGLAAAGSIGWGVGNVVAGGIGHFSTVFLLSGLFCLVGLFFASGLPDVHPAKIGVSLFPRDLIRKNARLYATFFLRHLGGNLIWIILPLYMISLGASLLWIGLLFLLNQSTQFVFAVWAGRLSDRIRETTLIRFGVLAAVLSFISYALATHFLHLLPAQIFIGIGWAFLYTGSLMNLTGKNVEKATATALLGDTIRLAMIFGPVAGGTIAFLFGFRATMYAAFALGIAALAISRKL